MHWIIMNILSVLVVLFLRDWSRIYKLDLITNVTKCCLKIYFWEAEQIQISFYNKNFWTVSIRFLDAKVNVVNVESLKKAGDINNETIHDNDDKIVVGVLLPRQLEANNDVVAKEHGVTRRQIVIKIILAHLKTSNFYFCLSFLNGRICHLFIAHAAAACSSFLHWLIISTSSNLFICS